MFSSECNLSPKISSNLCSLLAKAEADDYLKIWIFINKPHFKYPDSTMHGIEKLKYKEMVRDSLKNFLEANKEKIFAIFDNYDLRMIEDVNVRITRRDIVLIYEYEVKAKKETIVNLSKDSIISGLAEWYLREPVGYNHTKVIYSRFVDQTVFPFDTIFTNPLLDTLLTEIPPQLNIDFKIIPLKINLLFGMVAAQAACPGFIFYDFKYYSDDAVDHFPNDFFYLFAGHHCCNMNFAGCTKYIDVTDYKKYEYRIPVNDGRTVYFRVTNVSPKHDSIFLKFDTHILF